jgi:hypothetical protein
MDSFLDSCVREPSNMHNQSQERDDVAQSSSINSDPLPYLVVFVNGLDPKVYFLECPSMMQREMLNKCHLNRIGDPKCPEDVEAFLGTFEERFISQLSDPDDTEIPDCILVITGNINAVRS